MKVGHKMEENMTNQKYEQYHENKLVRGHYLGDAPVDNALDAILALTCFLRLLSVMAKLSIVSVIA